jgi:predicted DNA-binding transcriptional regulator YafY
MDFRHHDDMPKPSSDEPARLTLPQHERIFALVRLIQSRRYPNATTFEKELEVNRRTILRDLDYLKDRMHLPIEYDAKERGYYFSEPVENMPLLEMRESDLLWLFVGQHLLQQAANEELANQVRESFRRISDLFGSTISVRWDQLSTVLSSKTSGLGAAELRTFRAISEGLSSRREIRFDYRKSAKCPVERRHVRPVHSAFVNGQWYLFAHDIDRKATRTFVFSRMAKVTVTTKTFESDGLPGIQELLQNGFGVKWSSNKPVNVKLRVSSEIAHLICERKWHESQKITPDDSGGLLLELKVNTFKELTNWICSWGPLIEVLAPKELRTKVAETLREAATVYSTD